jgi:hypothetical protein
MFGEITMKLRSKVAIAAALLFGLSFALPADGTMSGIACLGVCWGVLANLGENHDVPLGGWCYYSAFVLANVLFVVLFWALLFWSAQLRLRLWIAIVSTLQVLSWLVVNLFALRNGDRFDLGIGYFIWLLSFVLLLAVHLVRPGTPNQSTDPSTAPGASHAGRGL